jgi:2-dehydro-3-deoxyphosphogalactonate aldolase
MRFEDAFREMPVAAILRGITPSEVVETCEALYKAGVRIVEVPMNSPEPLQSIKLLAKNFSGRLVCGAGTVLKPEWVDSVRDAGGEIVIAPNTNPDVVRRACARGLIPMPGFATPTEAFAALDSGARYLKLFPASVYGPNFLKQLIVVLPSNAVILPVGGVTAEDVATWWAAGARGFGIGSEIYRPGQPADVTYARALSLVTAVRQARDGL